MRILLAIVVIAAAAWSGWWWFQAEARQSALETWLAERRAAGWVAEAEQIEVGGYPNRVDATVTALQLADPAAGWSWLADELQILSLSYKPHHVIAALPGTQIFSTPYETLRTSSTLLRGSVVFEPSTRLALDRATFEIEDMALASTLGWKADIGHAMLAARQAIREGEPPHSYDVGFDAENVGVPDVLTTGLGAALPGEIGTMRLDTTLSFDRDWDRAALESDNPELQAVTVREISATWGRLDLRGRGRLDVDAQGYAEGRIDLTARNWRDMLDIAESSGALDPTLAGALRTGLELYTGFTGGGDALSLPLDFEDGRARLGPIVIGNAPRLAHRD